MAMGVPKTSGSFQINAGILGGIFTGSKDEYFSLPISGAGALNGAQPIEDWIEETGPRRQLSASFASHSGSVIMALNFLKASISDAEEVTFGEVNTALAAATGTITLGDNEDDQRWDVNFQKALSGAGGISGQSLTAANKFKVTSLGNVSSSEAAHFVKAVTGLSFAASSSLIAKTTVSGAGAVSGQNALFNNAWAVTTLGMVSSSKSAQYGGTIYANGAIQSSASITAKTDLSGAGGVAGQNAVFAARFTVTTLGNVSSSQAAPFVTAVTAKSFAASSSIVAKTTVSGAGAVSGQNLVLANGSWTAAGAISASANISTGGGTISGSGGIQGKSLTIGDETIVSDAGAVAATTSVVAATTVSGAGAVSGQNATFNNKWKVSTGGNVSSSQAASYGGTIYANGAIQGSASLVAGTTVSGAGGLSIQSIAINGNGASAQYQVTALGQVSSSNSAQYGGTLYANGAIQSSASIVAKTTLSAASDISGRSIIIEGTDNAEGTKEYKIAVAGGILTVTEQ